MANKIETIEGIGPAMAEKLAAANLTTCEQLLESCANPAGRKQVAEQTSISEGQLLKWANMADLMRVSGIGGEYAELLKASGVDTIKELRNRVPANLAEKAAQVNEEKKLTRVVPSADTIAKWVEQAKTIDPMITH